jgi:hypothetical protein
MQSFFIFVALLGFVHYATSNEPKKPMPVEIPLPEIAPKLPAADDLSGVYEMHGGTGSARYAGLAIIRKVGEGYGVQMIAGFGHSFVGIGFREGDRLTIAWIEKDMPGITTYKLDGKLFKGRWLHQGTMKWSDEELRYLRPYPNIEKE